MIHRSMRVLYSEIKLSDHHYSENGIYVGRIELLPRQFCFESRSYFVFDNDSPCKQRHTADSSTPWLRSLECEEGYGCIACICIANSRGFDVP